MVNRRLAQPLYGVSIDNAIRAGDRAEMEALLADAEALLAEEAAVRAALPEVEKRIGRGRGKPASPDLAVQPLYGIVIHDGLKKGDADELTELHGQAVRYLAHCDELRAALPGLLKALGRAG